MSTRENWDAKFERWDAAIRDGHVAKVRQELTLLQLAAVPTHRRARLGQLLVRANLPHKALAAMMAVVRIGSDIREDASTSDKLTYSMALIRAGFIVEAGELLATLPDTCPEKHLYSAYVYQTKWDYAAAIPRIERYLDLKTLSDYEGAVARVNLLACLIQREDTGRAGHLLAELEEQTKSKGWTLLSRTLLELGAQLAVAKRDWKMARKILKSAAGKRPDDQGIIDLFIAKWLAAADLMERPGGSPEALLAVRTRAVSEEHWETVRDCDRVLAECRKDQELFRFTYTGTPYASFREKMVRSCPWAGIPGQFLLGSPHGRVLDLLSGRFNDGAHGLKPGHVLHRALSALLSDFYRPISLGKFYADLFPGEYFNTVSSPQKVNSVVFRLRKWLAKENLPVQIEVKNNSFRATISGHHFGVLIHNVNTAADRPVLSLDGPLSELKRALPGQTSFTAQEAAQVLSLSRASTSRLLRNCLESGRITKQGNARHTVYKWAK